MKSASIALFALLAGGPALAQTTTPPPSGPTTVPPAATAPSKDMGYYQYTPGQMRASKLLGLNVKNNANETVGEINELILDKDGKVVAVVVGVGGFLGIGQREVALDYKTLNIKYDPNAMTDVGATTVTVDATKQSLSAAPAWSWNREGNAGSTTTPPRSTTPGGPSR
jgi:sporulation protein YlmC with PRC-barrel domain